MNGLVQVDYNGAQNTIAFGDSHLQTANTRLAVNGTLSSRRDGNSALAVVLTTGDLREIATLATIAQSAVQPGQPQPKLPQIAGSATLNAHVSGTSKDPRIQAQLTAQNLAIDGSHWRSLALNADARSSTVNIQNGVLIGSGREQINFSGSAGLQDWALAANSPVKLQASAANMSAADVEEIAQLHYPVTGTLAAKLSVSGTKSAPDGRAEITLAKGSAWNEPIENLSVNAQSHQGTIHSNIELQIPAGKISAEGNYALATQQYDVKLHGGGIHLGKIAALQKRGAVEGTAEISVDGSGTMREPQLDVAFAAPELKMQSETISKVDAKVHLANQHAAFELHSVVEQGSVEAKGDVDLNGNRYATATLDVRALPIAAVAANFAPTQAAKLGGQTEIHVTMRGPLTTPEKIEAHLEIPTLTATYDKAQLALARPLQADYRDGTLTVLPAQITGTGTNLTVGGTFPIKSAAPYSLAADGTIDLGVVQQFEPGLRSSGEIDVHIHSTGGASRPSMEGQFAIKNALFSSESFPVGIEGLNAQINLSGNRAEIVNFSGTAGGGQISGEGLGFAGARSGFQRGAECAIGARALSEGPAVDFERASEFARQEQRIEFDRASAGGQPFFHQGIRSGEFCRKFFG